MSGDLSSPTPHPEKRKGRQLTSCCEGDSHRRRCSSSGRSGCSAQTGRREAVESAGVPHHKQLSEPVQGAAPNPPSCRSGPNAHTVALLYCPILPCVSPTPAPHLFFPAIFIDSQNEFDALQADFQVTGGWRPQVHCELPGGCNLQGH